ncbi:DUF6377 domain-containing protein, partial [Bacteroides heparinolyticus]
MKRQLIPILFLFLPPLTVLVQGRGASADTLQVFALLHLLDEAIGTHKQYTDIRESRIARLKQRLADTDTADVAFFKWNGEIYKEYKAYVCDSAIHYLNANLVWAERRGSSEKACETRLELAYLMAATGMYEEASELLRQIDRTALPPRLLPDYYHCRYKLYEESGFYTSDDSFRERYQTLAACYEDSLMQLLPPASPLFLERQEERKAAQGDVDAALAINDARLNGVRPDTPEYALVTYQRSLLYRRLKNREEEKRYLALSALTDIRLCITDHASLWNLAQLLYEEGDIEHAYRYIRFSWDETNRYNARSRNLQTAGILSLIDLTYQAMQEKQNDCLR